MIIVSQDKKVILNFNNIVLLEIGEHIANMDGEKEATIEAFDEHGNTSILAYYDTEERAKEVLNEIERAYCSIEMLPFIQISAKDGIKGKDLAPIIAYEMPKE